VNGPEFVQYFWPVIEALRSLGGSGRPSEVRNRVAERLNVPDQKRTEMTAKGAPRFDNMVSWARFYLAKAGYLDASQRGVWRLTEEGRSINSMAPADALTLFSQVHATFADAKPPAKRPTGSAGKDDEIAALPDESDVQVSHRAILLKVLLDLPAAGFERLCQRLLRESGFEQVVVTGRSSDGGIDGHGVLQVNPFVSFKVLFQCKRYAGSVSPSQVRDFRGAMMGRADKGIIVTTGTFTAEAQKEALRDGVPPIELVNGEKLMDLFENLELGLKPRKTYDVDHHFFDEFRS
jgi:restriction system protein